MKKFYYSLLVIILAVISLTAAFTVFGQSRLERQRTDTIVGPDGVGRRDDAGVGMLDPQVSPNLVISQFQAGGATNANDEFIEIHNNGSAPVDLNGYRLVYRASTGTGDVNFYNWTTSTILQPGQYYLVASSIYAGAVAKDAGWDSATCACGLSATTGGGLAIRQGALNAGTVIDTVGWGTGTNVFVEGTRTTVPPNASSKRRLGGGCTDTDNNANDFETVTPSSPRNTASGVQTCSGGGTTIFASIGADPTTVVPSGNTLLTVTVVGATEPNPSTGLQVFGNLSQIGGSNLQQFYDDGTHGDAVAGDNVFTFDALVAASTTGGTKNITAVASDAEFRSANTSINITVVIPAEADNPLLFGNPTNAVANTSVPNNYLMIKPQYSLSYNNSTREPNWTAWRLDSTWIGSSGRTGNFAPDTTLPPGFVRVDPSDYSEPVYDRGHMCPSGDRTRSSTDNAATFLMTNMVPQLPDNNQGPWADFENYCRTLAGQGKEIYIISGPAGTIDNGSGMPKTIGANNVVVPKWTWKVVLILPNGTDDLHRVGKYTRVFGVIMSNEAITRTSPWRNFRVTVDQVEALTGYDFFSALPVNLQTRLESQPDTQ